MKLFPLLLAVLLLCGCGAQNPESTAPTPMPAAVQATEVTLHEEPFLERMARESALQRFRLKEEILGFLPLGDDLLFFSGSNATTLTLVDPEENRILARHDTDFVLTPQNATVRRLREGLSYFNSAARETVVLNASLEEIRKIPAPDDLTGMPLLSADGNALYYCTPASIRVLDLTTGISRILKEASYPVQGISGLLLGDTVVQISITEADGTWKTLFLSTENGRLLGSPEGNILPQTSDTHYFLYEHSNILCGSADGPAMVFEPEHADIGCWYLPGSNRVFSCGMTDGSTVLEAYELTTGLRIASLTVPGFLFPEQTGETSDGGIWFLTDDESGQLLLCWDPAASAVREEALYTHPHYTREDPDYEGLAACALYAQEIGSRYGIDILVYKDAAATEPWDYRLEYEYRANVLRRELEALEGHLSRFPEGFLQTLRNTFTALKICLVRNAEATPESGGPGAVNGIQFLEGFDAYIVLATEYDTQYALYHELCHLMETVVLTESTAYDRWDRLNPEGFTYPGTDSDRREYLQPGRQYFVDAYSMTAPKEDRARLFEFAMTAGHEALFRSPNLQHKLRQLSAGIQEGFGLTNHTDPLPWEQYLTE